MRTRKEVLTSVIKYKHECDSLIYVEIVDDGTLEYPDGFSVDGTVTLNLSQSACVITEITTAYLSVGVRYNSVPLSFSIPIKNIIRVYTPGEPEDAILFPYVPNSPVPPRKGKPKLRVVH